MPRFKVSENGGTVSVSVQEVKTIQQAKAVLKSVVGVAA
jgi:hypothetical protein